MVKNPLANGGDVRDVGLIPGLGRSPGGGHGNPLQYSCHKNPMSSMKRLKDMTLEYEPFRLEGVQYAIREEKIATTNSSRKNEEAGSKQK